MTTSPAPALRARMFAAAEARLLEELGSVSIVKFLGGTTPAEAQARWFEAIDAFAAALPEGVAQGVGIEDGAPVLHVAEQLTFRLDLLRLEHDPFVLGAWRLGLDPRLAPAVTDRVAVSLWGQPWREALAALVPDSQRPEVVQFGEPPEYDGWRLRQEERIRRHQPDAPPISYRGWRIEGDPSTTWSLWFANKTHAREASIAILAGADAVTALFESFRADARAAADAVVAELREAAGSGLGDVHVDDLRQTVEGAISFTITATLYAAVPVVIRCHEGETTAAIDLGSREVAVPADPVHLDREARLRVPDKLLATFDPDPDSDSDPATPQKGTPT